MSNNTQNAEKSAIKSRVKIPQVHKKPPKIKKGVLEIKKKNHKKIIAKGTSTTKILQIQTDLEAVVTNQITGETEKYDNVLLRRIRGDFNYDKIFLLNHLEVWGMIGGAKLKASLWILNNRDANNYVFVTCEKLATACNISLKTANITLKLLRQHNFLTQPKGTRGGVYQVNPEMIFKGNHNKRMSVLTIYEKNREQVLPIFDEKEDMKDE